MKDPMGMTERYLYDTAGNMVTKYDRNGTELRYGTKVWDTEKGVCENNETGVRVHSDSKMNIHGYPVNLSQYLK